MEWDNYCNKGCMMKCIKYGFIIDLYVCIDTSYNKLNILFMLSSGFEES